MDADVGEYVGGGGLFPLLSFAGMVSSRRARNEVSAQVPTAHRVLLISTPRATGVERQMFPGVLND